VLAEHRRPAIVNDMLTVGGTMGGTWAPLSKLSGRSICRYASIFHRFKPQPEGPGEGLAWR
jgi:hypothetical protein